MEPGIYSVEFGTNSNSGLGGLVVIQGGTINGGDLSYLYRGAYTQKGNDSLAANLTVSHYRGAVNSVFGPLKEFKISFNIQSNEGNGFHGKGFLEGYPNLTIYVEGTKQADLND